MFNIGQYKIIETLFESDATAIYRAINQTAEATGIPEKVVLKQLNHKFPSAEQLAKFEQEYDMTTRLGSKGIVCAFDLIRYENSRVMVLEDIDAQSLDQVYDNKTMDLSEFWRFANNLIDTLALVHSKNIIHKDVNPSNIILNVNSGQLKLIDFGISVELSSESIDAKTSGTIRGTLPYLSPEQTGRMNRELDYRSDIYSLGITFYQLLTGTLPFTATDALEWVHAHIAVTPPLASERIARIPLALSKIIAKMLSKNAEDRYQTLAGLKHDLGICQAQFSHPASTEIFPLGQQDLSREFQLSRKIYGRGKDIEEMLQLYEKMVAGQKAVLTVGGSSGIGKTSLVRELQKPVIAQKGYYSEGKFNQYQRATPYSAIVQALNSMVQQILTESQAHIDEWKKHLLHALESNGQLIVDVIPDLVHIIGEQPPLEQVKDTEVETRFNRTLLRFFRGICEHQRPVVIFLDDMQWSDLATLSLISKLSADVKVKHLFLVLAYRDNEVSETHAFHQLITELEDKAPVLRQITLGPLSEENLTHHIASSLHLSPDICSPLAQLCHQKTLGNPFYFNQLLHSIYEAGYLRFDLQTNHWAWDEAALTTIASTDNVVELMLNKMSHLDIKVQHLLQMAAVVGDRFDLFILQALSNSSAADVGRRLLTAAKSGLIIPLDASYQWAPFLKMEGAEDSNYHSDVKHQYKFLHDRVQQAAYVSMTQGQRKQLHGKIARTLLTTLDQQQIQERVFEIVGHFNDCDEEFAASDERLRVMELNFNAAIKARESAAFSPSENYFAAAIRLVDKNDWQTEPQQIYALYAQAAEVACLNASYDTMESLLASIRSSSASELHRLQATKIEIQALVAQSRSADAVSKCLEALDLIGITIPSQPELTYAQACFNDALKLQPEQTPEDLLQLPEVQDEKIRLALDLMKVAAVPAYQSVPTLFAVMVSKMVQLSKTYGNCKSAIFGYSTFAMIVNGFTENAKLAAQYDKLARNLVVKLSATEIETSVKFLSNTFVRPWLDPIKDTVKKLKANSQLALTRGDYEYAAQSETMAAEHSFQSGTNLTSLLDIIATNRDIIKETGQETFYSHISISLQAVHNLTCVQDAPYMLQGKYFDEAKMLTVMRKTNDVTALGRFYAFKLMIAFLAECTEKAHEYAADMLESMSGVVSSFFVPHFYFYSSLVRVFKLQSNQISDDDVQYLKDSINKFEAWALDCEDNFQCRLFLLTAELQRITTTFSKSTIQCYQAAIKAARDSGCLQEEALANELLARYWFEHEQDDIAQLYLEKAYHLYDIWGCVLRTNCLSKEFYQIQFLSPERGLHERPSTLRTQNKHNSLKTGAEQQVALDFLTIMKSSQLISREIVREKLLHSIMLLLLESAGAQTGKLLLKSDEQWRIVSAADSRVKQVDLEETEIDIAGVSDILPMQIFQYAVRTGATVVYPHSRDNIFSHDPYIIANEPASVLCVPLLHRNEIDGLIFLENRLIKDAFSEDRVQVIQLLASQLVISMENADLYADMESRVKDRTSELNKANEKLTLLATTDPLTGANNRRQFIELANKEVQKTKRNGRVMSVMMVDIDFFKKVNDNYGHLAGDEALKQVVRVFSQILRPGDIFGRLGGEEFAVLLPETDLTQGKIVAERLRKQVESTLITSEALTFYVTISIGIMAYCGTELTLEHIMHTADQGLYKAKNGGRNRIEVA